LCVVAGSIVRQHVANAGVKSSEHFVSFSIYCHSCWLALFSS